MTLIFEPSSDVEFSFGALLESSLELVISQGRTHPFLDELVDLLRCPSIECIGIQERVKLILDGIEIGVFSHTIDEIVVQSELLDLVCSLMGQNLHHL